MCVCVFYSQTSGRGVQIRATRYMYKVSHQKMLRFLALTDAFWVLSRNFLSILMGIVEHTLCSKITPWSFYLYGACILYSNALYISTNPLIETREIIFFGNTYFYFLWYDLNMGNKSIYCKKLWFLPFQLVGLLKRTEHYCICPVSLKRSRSDFRAKSVRRPPLKLKVNSVVAFQNPPKKSVGAKTTLTNILFILGIPEEYCKTKYCQLLKLHDYMLWWYWPGLFNLFSFCIIDPDWYIAALNSS